MTMTTEKLLQRAASVIDQVKVGVMMTVDESGAPQGRWMGASTRHGLSRLYTLTAKNTRKIAELQKNPRVCWMFTAPDFSDVVVLHGRAEVHEGGSMLREAWDMLKETGQTYGVGPMSDDQHLETCVVETFVESIELTSPELDLPTPQRVTLPD